MQSGRGKPHQQDDPPAADRLVIRLAAPDTICDPELVAAYEAMLCDEERERYRSFRFPEDQRLYLVSHALLRTTLSSCAPLASEDWRFIRLEHGRPEIAPEIAESCDLRFSLSHTRGLAACAVTQRVDIGVDVERTVRPTDWQAVASRYFAPQESRQLAEVPPEQQCSRFFEYWTLKEAYVKAVGSGLSTPLDSFYFRQDKADQWRICFESPTTRDPQAWHFDCFAASDEHILAFAVRGAGQQLRIDVQHCVPLMES